MSSGGQRPPANRMTLQTFKGRLTGAKKGHSLLKKKRDALKAKFQALLKDIVDTKLTVGQTLKDAALGFAKAQWASSGDDISATVMERAKRPSVTCKLGADNVAGVSIPVFKMQHDPTKDAAVSSIGIAHGGAVVNACRGEYFKSLTALVRLASLQTAFKTLDEEIKMTGRRVNALEYVLIPRIEEVCHYITQEMDEEAREEFFRVKKVVEKKRAKIAKEKAEEAREELLRDEKIAEKKPAVPKTSPEPVPPPAEVKKAPPPAEVKQAPPPAEVKQAPPPAEVKQAPPPAEVKQAPPPTEVEKVTPQKTPAASPPTPEPAEDTITSPGAPSASAAATGSKKNKNKKKKGSEQDAPSALDSKKDDDLVF